MKCCVCESRVRLFECEAYRCANVVIQRETHDMRVYISVHINFLVVVYNEGPVGVERRAIARRCLWALYAEEANMRARTIMSFSARMYYSGIRKVSYEIRFTVFLKWRQLAILARIASATQSTTSVSLARRVSAKRK